MVVTRDIDPLMFAGDQSYMLYSMHGELCPLVTVTRGVHW